MIYSFSIIIMFLAQALGSLKYFEENGDRQQVLAKTLKNPEKLAKTFLRIEFLTACRRNKITPRFIEDSLRPVSRIFLNNSSVNSRCRQLSASLLNEAIAETHRKRAYLIRERDRLASTVKCFLNESRISYVYATCERIFDETVRENRPRLVRKFHSRMYPTERTHTGGGGVADVGEGDAEGEGEVEDEGRTGARIKEKVKNISSLVLDKPSLELLSKGPNFALTQKISKAVILEAEKGVERLAYAKRWKDAMAKSRRAALAPIANYGAVVDDGRPEPASAHPRSITNITGQSVLALTPSVPGATGGDGTAGVNSSTRAVEATFGMADIDTRKPTAEAVITARQGHSSSMVEPTSAHTGRTLALATGAGPVTGTSALALTPPVPGATGGDGTSGDRDSTTAVGASTGTVDSDTRGAAAETGMTTRQRSSSRHTGRIDTGPSALALTPPAPGAARGDGTSGDRGSTAAAAAVTTAASAASGIADVDTGGAAAEAGVVTGQRHSTQSGLSFRFADTDKRFPPPSSIEVELKLRKLKEEVVKTYKNHTHVKDNVSDDERKFLRNLQKNDDLVVKQSDKCKGFVIMDKSTYLDKARDILGNSDSYEKLDRNPVPKVEAQTKRIFRSVSKDKLPEKTIKELTPIHSRTPVFYGLPKDHKPSIPLRPVISACDGPTNKTSCLIERILKQLLKFVPTHLWNTQDFLNKIRAHSERNDIAEQAIFFSIDVVNLYGSIPVAEAIDAVTEKLSTHLQEVDTFGLTSDDVKVLLEQCLTENVFSFDDRHYRQKLGIAMGNPCAPPVAIIFLDRLERHALENASKKPKFLVRYIDDYAGIWSHGEEALLDFLAYLNTVHDTIKFTIEHSGGGAGVPFLDTLVTVETRGGRTTVETELYIKPTNSGIILNYLSAHPTQTKHNTARGQFIRAIKNSSNDSKEDRSILKIWNLLSQNGYPRHVLSRLLREARQRGGTRTSTRTRGKNFDGYLCLPYVDEQLLCKIKSKIKKSGLDVRVAWQNKDKLKTMLVRSSLTKPKCPGGPRCHTCKSGFTGDCTQKKTLFMKSNVGSVRGRAGMALTLGKPRGLCV